LTDTAARLVCLVPDSHWTGIITPGDDGNSLEMTFPTTGTTQEWTRVDDSQGPMNRGRTRPVGGTVIAGEGFD
jgi:hypothetical protein